MNRADTYDTAMNVLPLGFLLLSIILLKVSARPSLNATAAKSDVDVTCFRESQRFSAISYEACEPLVTYLESFTHIQEFSGLDFPQTYNVREAPRCQVIIHTARVVREAFAGSEFGTAAGRVLNECASRTPERIFSFGGFVVFRPRWHAEVRAVRTGVGINQTLVTHPPDVAIE